MVGVDVELDAKGMYCPMPIVKLKKATKTMEPGQVLKLVATDPGSARDVPAWANKTGAEILETSEENGEYTFIIRVS
ncbi:sulfurtransferase TusA family protein [Candidatus Bathyarchaeota archaeon]|jgi:tRNA 2-thiouridine synthesizing protein A|nr:MAG: sulfurtransferase TusA family protein [Candidatus Bathyarchaeota archaeon]